MTKSKKLKFSREIKETTEYSLFTVSAEAEIMPAPLNGKRLAALKQSIHVGGQLVPICVDANLAVLDGRSRLLACQELSLPVRYQVVPVGRDALETVLDGAQQREWTIVEKADFIRHIKENAGVFGIKPKKDERLRDAVGAWLQARLGWSFGMSGKNIDNHVTLSERFEITPDELLKERASQAATLNEALEILPKPHMPLAISKTPLPKDKRLKLLNQVIGEFQTLEDDGVNEEFMQAARAARDLLDRFLHSTNVA